MQLSAASVPAKNSSAKQGEYTEGRRRFWDDYASKTPRRWIGIRRHYEERLTQIYRFLVPRGARVLELGCGQGDLLAALEPAAGVGVDFSSRMIGVARERYPSL